MNEHRSIHIEKPESSEPESGKPGAGGRLNPFFYLMLIVSFILSGLGLLCFFLTR